VGVDHVGPGLFNPVPHGTYAGEILASDSDNVNGYAAATGEVCYLRVRRTNQLHVMAAIHHSPNLVDDAHFLTAVALRGFSMKDFHIRAMLSWLEVIRYYTRSKPSVA
jgi:hypothetical protein